MLLVRRMEHEVITILAHRLTEPPRTLVHNPPEVLTVIGRDPAPREPSQETVNERRIRLMTIRLFHGRELRRALPDYH
eukprot:1174654-Alexandrium_andersonii.AAC.1